MNSQKHTQCGTNVVQDTQPMLEVRYCTYDKVDAILTSQHVLAVLTFGGEDNRIHHPANVHIPLPISGPPVAEIWLVNAPTQTGNDGNIRWVSSGQLLFGSIQLPEDTSPLEDIASHVYAQIHRFTMHSPTGHILRMWNYFDSINQGKGDQERYRRFCVGRARGFALMQARHYPAATAIGCDDPMRMVRVYWLASSAPGISLENPRQISAYHYPKDYGPQPPSFARAMLDDKNQHIPLCLSGTAAIVGHNSLHHGNVLSQLEEIYSNFSALLQRAHTIQPHIPLWFSAHSRLKIYSRHLEDVASVRDAITARLPNTPCLYLQGEICRKELLVEIDGFHC